MSDQGDLSVILEKLDRLFKQPEDQWLEQDELSGLRDVLKHREGFLELLSYKEELIEFASYRRARKLILKTWHKLIILIAGGVATLVALKANLLELLQWLTKS